MRSVCEKGVLEANGERDEEDQEEEIEAFIEVGEQEGLLEEGERHLDPWRLRLRRSGRA